MVALSFDGESNAIGCLRLDLKVRGGCVVEIPRQEVVGGFGNVGECGRGHCESRCAEVKGAVLRKTFRLIEGRVGLARRREESESGSERG